MNILAIINALIIIQKIEHTHATELGDEITVNYEPQLTHTALIIVIPSQIAKISVV